jgi:toxin ParE1/3/4
MKVVWTDLAKQHLQLIFDHIEPQSEIYAQRAVNKIVSRADDLGTFPEMGRIVPEYNNPRVRELLVSPHRVIYAIREDRIDVIGVIHTAQDR